MIADTREGLVALKILVTQDRNYNDQLVKSILAVSKVNNSPRQDERVSCELGLVHFGA